MGVGKLMNYIYVKGHRRWRATSCEEAAVTLLHFQLIDNLAVVVFPLSTLQSWPLRQKTHTQTLTFDMPEKHKAAVYDKLGNITTNIEEHDMPEPGPGEVLVRL